jgi:hypothetical protein
VIRAKACVPFVANDDSFLAFCLTARAAGRSASELFGISDKLQAYAFDDAVAMRLHLYDRDMRKEAASFIAIEVGRLFGGQGLDALDSAEGSAGAGDGDVEVW